MEIYLHPDRFSSDVPTSQARGVWMNMESCKQELIPFSLEIDYFLYIQGEFQHELAT